MKKQDLLDIYISDYLKMFDNSANYEMQQGINPLFADEMVRIISTDVPWKNMSSSQLRKVLLKSFTEVSSGVDKTITKGLSPDELERISRRNRIRKERNESKFLIQEMIKKMSVEMFARDLEDPDSIIRDQEMEHSKCGNTAPGSSQKNVDKTLLKKPEITVVIPMYNCAEFVSSVLSMFASQSFSNFEVICVIDGATDNTEEQVKYFCNKDERFRYTVRENGGAGAARNTGLDMAHGRYILWADADDEYYPDYLKKLYETAVRFDAQIAICLFYQSDVLMEKDAVLGFDANILFENVIYSHRGIDDLFIINPRVPNKIYNTEFVRKNGLRFPEIQVSEDSFFSYASLSIADRIMFSHDVLLKYRMNTNPDSITSKRNRYLHHTVTSLRKLYNWLKDHDLLDVHRVDFLQRANRLLIFDGIGKVTPRFIAEFAHMLNAEEPWDSMTVEEILMYFKESLIATEFKLKEAEMRTRIGSKIIESDKELSFLYDYYKNMMHTAEMVCRVSKERYGRDFEQTDRMLHSHMDN